MRVHAGFVPLLAHAAALDGDEDAAGRAHARQRRIELAVAEDALRPDEHARALQRLPLRLVDGVGKSEADGELAAVQIEGEAALVRLT